MVSATPSVECIRSTSMSVDNVEGVFDESFEFYANSAACEFVPDRRVPPMGSFGAPGRRPRGGKGMREAPLTGAKGVFQPGSARYRCVAGGSRPASCGSDLVLRVAVFSQPKIPQLDVTLGVVENIGGLQVAMDDPLGTRRWALSGRRPA